MHGWKPTEVSSLQCMVFAAIVALQFGSLSAETLASLRISAWGFYFRTCPQLCDFVGSKYAVTYA
jgi:hypothetical protein